MKTLRVFVDVAAHNGFAAAARAHDLDPSSVSRLIGALEQELGVRLFQRTTRRLALSEAGAAYLPHVQAVLAELERAGDEARAISTKPTGKLRLTTSVAFGQACVVPHLGAFREAYPQLELELLLTDATLDLVGDKIDVAIRLGANITGNVVAAKLRRTRYHVCASPAYLDAAGWPAAPVELTEHGCLVFAIAEFRRTWLFRDAGGVVVEVPIRPSFVISNALALREAARGGLGPALLADWLIEPDLARGDLVDLFPDQEVTATSFATAAWLVYPSRAFVPSKVRVTVDFLRRHLGR